jgi:hypothetical protein
MFGLRFAIVLFLGAWMAAQDWPAGWTAAAFFTLGWWHCWACYVSPPFSELLRRVGRLIEAIAE